MRKLGIRIWDSHNLQWLEPISISFNNKNEIARVCACMPNADILKDGWYDLKGDDLNKIAIVGDISMNVELVPKEGTINILNEVTRQKDEKEFVLNHKSKGHERNSKKNRRA